MKRGRWIAAVALGVAVGVGAALPIAAQSQKQLKQARKLLEKLKLVDGAGSGLDADTLRGMAPSAFLGAGAKAADSAKLNGQDPSAFLGANAKAADSNKLDGIDSTGFLQRGEIDISQNGLFGVNFGIDNGSVEEFTDVVRISAAGAGAVWAQLHLMGPVTLGGLHFGLSAVEVCYRVTAGDKIDATSIYDQSDGTTHLVFEDPTDRTFSTGGQAECYTATAPGPIVPAGSLMLVLKFAAAGSGDFMDIATVLAKWVPTP